MVPPTRSGMYQFQQKLKALKSRICTWNKEDFGNIFQDKKRLMSQLEVIQRRGMNDFFGEYLKQKEEDPIYYISSRERKEEIYGNQRSRNQ